MSEMNFLQFNYVCRSGEVKLRIPLLKCRILIKHPGSHPAVLIFLPVIGIMQNDSIFLRPGLYEYIIAETVVTMQYRHESHHLRAMRDVIWRISPVRSGSHTGKGSADKIVDHRDPLSCETQTHFGKQDIVVDQSRAVTYFYKQILRHHSAFQLFDTLRTLIIVQIIAAYSCALRFPVAPDAHCTVMDMVSPNNNIDSCVQFDTGDLCSSKLHHIVDVMDVIILNYAEDASHAADDAALLAMMYIVAADNVSAYVFLQPSVILSAAYGVTFHLCRAFYIFCSKVVVVVRIIVSSERDAGALAVHYLAVLYYPALAPVRPYHAVLKSCRRSPCSRGFLDLETPDGNIVSACFRRPEALSPDIDLYFFTVRIESLKIRIYNGFVAVFILFCVPFILRIIRIPADFT